MADDDKKTEFPKPAAASSEPANPSERSSSSEPSKSSEPSSSSEPSKTAAGEGARDEPKLGSAAVAKPLDTGTPAGSGKPSDTDQLSGSGKIDDAKPSDVTKAAGLSKPSDAAKAAERASPGRPGGPGSEWTASDDRGPLGRAEEENEAAIAAGAAKPSGPKPAAGGATPVAPLVASTSKTGESKTGESKTSDGKAGGSKTGTTTDGAKSGAADKGFAKTAAAGSAIPPVDAAASGTPSGGSTASARPTAMSEPKRSLWPVAAALIIGALIGAGSAAFVYRGYADDTQPDPKVASLTTRVDALEKRPDPQSSIATLKSSVTALDNQVAALRQGKASAAPAPAPEPASKPDPAPAAAPPPTADLGEVNRKIAALQSQFDALKAGGDTKALERKIGALQGELDKAKSVADAAQTGVSTVQGQQKEIAGRVMMPALAVVSDSLVQQIDHGQPYAAQVDALATLGADPARIAVLRQNAAKGVPSARELGARFEPLASPIAATAHKAPPNAGLGERLKSGMLSIVSIRRADDTSGDDLPSRVARIKAALAHDDVAGALDAWSKLPPDAKAKAEAWGALAKTHVDAMNAAHALQQDAIAALGARKS